MARQRKKYEWEDRYDSYVDTSGGLDACYPWLGCLDKNGYGVLSVEGRQRFSTHCQFKIRTGEWPPKGKLITHKVCGNPPCCNHRHLRLGTY